MSSLRCIVCGRPTDLEKRFEGRPYCEAHLHSFWDGKTPFWQVTGIAFGLLLITTLGVIVLAQLSEAVSGLGLLIVSAAITLLPALAWMLLIYRGMSRMQQSPSPLIGVVFLLAVLLAAAIFYPLIYGLLDLNAWLAEAAPINRFLGNVLIRGLAYVFLLYSMIRYSLWRTPLFERRIDGMVYGLAGCWGLAAVLTFLPMFNLPQMLVLHGGLRAIAQMCAYISAGLLVGYVLARTRFEDMPQYYSLLGLGAAALINGGMLYASTELNIIRLNLTTDGYSPWPGIVVSFLLLLLVYGVVFGLLNRHNRLARSRLQRSTL